MTEANVKNSRVPGQKKEVKRNKWEMKQKKKKARQPLTPLLQTYCTPVTVVLQTVAVVLQSRLQRHCKKDAATLQWTYSNLTVRSQDFKVWRY